MRRVAYAVFALALGSASAMPALAQCTGTAAQCAAGQFGAPFDEPTLLGVTTSERCVVDGEGKTRCKPTAGTLVALDDDRFLYWNALEGTEDVEVSIVAEFGYASANDQSRLLVLGPGDAPSWKKLPDPIDGGAVENPDGIGPCQDVMPVPDGGADAALFCSDQKILHDGRVLAAGGTNYFNDSCIDFEGINAGTTLPFTPGASELEGIKNTRIFDPKTNKWTQTDSMEFGRWYPSMVTLPDGDLFIASGVTRLIKPVYPDDPTFSGRNVFQTETYDTACGTWSNNGSLAERSLPLFPRMHLLPNGRPYYNAGGQAFNPFGQAYDELLWNIVSSYDPATKTWADHAIAGFPLQLSPLGLQSIATDLNPTNPNAVVPLLAGLLGRVIADPQAFATLLGAESVALLSALTGMDWTDPNTAMAVVGGGFRGTTFSVMLPLRPDASGNYTRASFLTAGGIQSTIANPSPGSYVATALSRIDTMDLSASAPKYSSRVTGSLNAPRWYGSGTLLPNGQVLATSGSDRDEVMTPGFEIPVTVAELFDPATETWTQVATQNRDRTYHNSAALMRDGRVLIGGHAPITTGYTSHTALPEPFTQGVGRDPSFEIYSPWYVYRSDRPAITGVGTKNLVNGGSFTATVPGVSTNLDSMVLMRRTAHTHLVDGDQHAVVLRVLSINPLTSSIKLAVPDTRTLPPGQYVLFANVRALDGKIVPSKGIAVSVGSGVVGACQ